MAEIVHHYFPKLVELHNYRSGRSGILYCHALKYLSMHVQGILMPCSHSCLFLITTALQTARLRRCITGILWTRRLWNGLGVRFRSRTWKPCATVNLVRSNGRSRCCRLRSQRPGRRDLEGENFPWTIQFSPRECLNLKDIADASREPMNVCRGALTRASPCSPTQECNSRSGACLRGIYSEFNPYVFIFLDRNILSHEPLAMDHSTRAEETRSGHPTAGRPGRLPAPAPVPGGSAPGRCTGPCRALPTTTGCSFPTPDGRRLVLSSPGKALFLV